MSSPSMNLTGIENELLRRESAMLQLKNESHYKQSSLHDRLLLASGCETGKLSVYRKPITHSSKPSKRHNVRKETAFLN